MYGTLLVDYQIKRDRVTWFYSLASVARNNQNRLYVFTDSNEETIITPLGSVLVEELRFSTLFRVYLQFARTRRWLSE